MVLLQATSVKQHGAVVAHPLITGLVVTPLSPLVHISQESKTLNLKHFVINMLSAVSYSSSSHPLFSCLDVICRSYELALPARHLTFNKQTHIW